MGGQNKSVLAFLRYNYRKVSKKKRRHSGWEWSNCHIPQRILDEEGIILEPYWDDWNDYRGGCRGSKDRTKIQKVPTCCGWNNMERKSRNKQIKKRLAIRKARKRSI